MEHGLTDIDALVREEKRLTAVESHNEAWAEGLSAGIEPESSPKQRLPPLWPNCCEPAANRRRWR